MLTLPQPLLPMAAYHDFVLWDTQWDEAKNKFTKWPINPHTGKFFPKDSGWQQDRSQRADFETASAAALKWNFKVGYLISDINPFWFVDLDDALMPDGQSWSPFAMEVLAMFPGCAVEVSYSGKGLHIFGTGAVPEKHRNRDDSLGLEVYSRGRFAAITGTNAIGNALTDGTSGFNFLLNKYLPGGKSERQIDWTSEPDEEWNGPDDDDELIAKMLKARPSAAAAFGSRAPLKALWEGDEGKLAEFFPSKSGDVFDRSSADSALCHHLAFWTGKNCERIQRIFERSGLMRDKWTDRQDYREDTITKAAGGCSAVYKAKKKPNREINEELTIIPEDFPEGVIREGFQFLGLPQQLEHFKGCVYVTRNHAIKVPNGTLLKSEQFRANYGGYWFAMDSIGDKSSRNAWEVFTESQGLRFPRADFTCFRPELPPGTIIEEDGQTLVNTYVVIQPKRIAGDPSLFLRHLEKLLPSPRDREILISYMAACVQKIGVKFRWSPFIQGVPGNGKSEISKVVARAIGNRYSHSPAASDIANKFNDWIEGKLFIYVEDVYTADRQEVLETLKPLVTETLVEVQPKGASKYMTDNRANFILNSNHKDGIRKTLDDRRYAPFYTLQQTREDLIRDGMGSHYFQRLSDWLKKEDGYAIMTDFLHNFEIKDEFNPELMSEAPLTSSTGDALAVGMGGIEQEIMEAINQDRPGFMGGWVSSLALDRLIKERKDDRKLPLNKRKDVMASLGFILHPNLPEGRAGSAIAIDGGSKPRLYIKRDHLHCQLNTNAAIVEAYTKAQEVGGLIASAPELFKQK